MDEMTPLHRARALLDSLTPLKTDCGRLCGGACCAGDEQTGMLLFPGEERFYDGCDFGRIVPANFSLGGRAALLFVCRGRCERANRPLACRLFPLFLAFGKDGTPRLRMDPRSADVCPLYGSGIAGLSSAFVDAAKEAYGLLLDDEACAAYLRDLHRACSL